MIQPSISNSVIGTGLEPAEPAGPTSFGAVPVQSAVSDRLRLVPYRTDQFCMTLYSAARDNRKSI